MRRFNHEGQFILELSKRLALYCKKYKREIQKRVTRTRLTVLPSVPLLLIDNTMHEAVRTVQAYRTLNAISVQHEDQAIQAQEE